MHELSIALSIVAVAEEEAERQGNARVCAVFLKLGPLSGVVKEALLSAFELAREDSALATAELHIEEVPIRGDCPVCLSETTVKSLQELCCENCGSPLTKLVSGQELEIVALEIAT